VNALDVLRAMRREPDTIATFFAEVETANDSRLDRAVNALKRDIASSDDVESRARRMVECMGIVLQASLLLRHGDPAVADLFCSSRLNGEWGHTFGSLPSGPKLKSVLERHRPRF
jgi:putative acyl-CoA dehydrogenase